MEADKPMEELFNIILPPRSSTKSKKLEFVNDYKDFDLPNMLKVGSIYIDNNTKEKFIKKNKEYNCAICGVKIKSWIQLDYLDGEKEDIDSDSNLIILCYLCFSTRHLEKLISKKMPLSEEKVKPVFVLLKTEVSQKIINLKTAEILIKGECFNPNKIDDKITDEVIKDRISPETYLRLYKNGNELYKEYKAFISSGFKLDSINANFTTIKDYFDDMNFIKKYGEKK